MSEYKIGKIYKIIHNQSDLIYIGSTISTLRDRFYQHKKSLSCIISKYFSKYGIENFKIILIKEYKICDRTHLEMYEQLWINKMKCININNPFEILRKLANMCACPDKQLLRVLIEFWFYILT